MKTGYYASTALTVSTHHVDCGRDDYQALFSGAIQRKLPVSATVLLK